MTTQPIDPDRFKSFEKAGWSDAGVAGQYSALWTDLTSQSIEALLDAARVQAGTRLLEVACGPGHLSAAAAARGARPVGVDFSAAMIEMARRDYAGLEFEEGDAEALAFRDGGFDAVVMSFGLLHLARPEQAVAEARRVLRPGGRFAFTVWAPPEEAVGFRIVLGAVEAHGNSGVAVPPGPPFFRFSDHDECKRVLEAAGFVGPEVRLVAQTWRVPDPDALLVALREGTVRTRALLRVQTPEALTAIAAACRAAAGGYRAGDGVEIPMPCVLACATKP